MPLSAVSDGEGLARVGTRRISGLAAIGAAAVVALAGCTSGSGHLPIAHDPPASRSAPVTGDAPSTSPSTPPGAAPAAVAFAPADGAKDVNPTSPVKVGVTAGTLASVAMTNAAGTTVQGTTSATKKAWTSAEVLGYGKTYTLTVAARNVDGGASTRRSSFTTITPPNMTMPYLDTTGGGALSDGATYGVGMVVNVHWDEAISDKAAAEKTLTVTTSPKVTGSWYWVDDQSVHWRPAHYYTPGTRVTVAAKVYGKQVSPGLWGQQDVSTRFRVGESHVSIADDHDKRVRVYFGGKLVRTMPTSMGKGGTDVIDGHTISYWTQRGTYTVLDKSNPVLMDSTTYGLPQSKGGYKEYINWATRISTDGVYLHELDSTVPEQGNTNTSHGCLNLNRDNATWFYQHARVGDVVQVKNTGGSPLAVWQNGDWSVPWTEWAHGSALR